MVLVVEEVIVVMVCVSFGGGGDNGVRGGGVNREGVGDGGVVVEVEMSV